MKPNELDNPTRERFVSLALSYEGIREGSEAHADMVNEFNKRSDYRMTVNDKWCAMFVSLINLISGGHDYSSSFPDEINCEQMVKAFKAKRRWIANDGSFIPQYGDIVFYENDNDPNADHVGIIVEVASGNRPTMKVIEGNYSDRVKIRTLGFSDSRIIGYGLPRFR